MKKFRIILLLVTCGVFLTAFKKNGYDYPTRATNAVSIANSSIVEGNSGQRSVEVMVIISTAQPSPMTVEYRTKNGSASAGSDYIASNGIITFAPGDIMKRITVSIIGDLVCEPTETFEIVLNNASGAIFSDSMGKVTIVNDDCRGGGAGGGTTRNSVSIYEVRLTYTGYTTLFVGPPDCPVRTNGKVVLTGLLSGAEDVEPDDDINYTGLLQLDIDMDICSAKRLPNGEDKFCRIRAFGSGEVNTELEIYFDQRGGYVKIQDESGEFIRLANGDCDNAQIMEEQIMIPNKTIASIFNGYELPMLTARTLGVGRYVLQGEAGETVVEVLRKITR